MIAAPPPAPSASAVPLIPESAPFSAAQRAWLNGFFAGLYGGAPPALGSAASEPPRAEDFPWHDPGLELEERLRLAAGRPLERRLMACMAQLDCGQCGYLCRTYAEALASGAESSTALCVPGGKATQKALKSVLADARTPAPAPVAAAAEPARDQPVRFVAADRLTAPGSAKDVRRVVLEFGDAALAYEPGDSLAVAARNDPALVEAVLAVLGATGDDGAREELLRRRDIARPQDRTLELLAGAARRPEEARALRALAEGEDGAEPADADLLDLLDAFPSARPPLAELLASLPPLRPRLYSIASSPLARPGTVELCVRVVRTERRGRRRDGVASCHLAFRADAATPLAARVQTSHFRLPADPATAVVMVGPGTGIAPFRAFLQHRAETGASGRNWLFFGEQHRATDFLFADEIAAWRERGPLTRLSLAWSRDGEQRTYVQHCMAEAAAELWSWLQEGAHFYVCGDAARMARDVDAALRGIACSEGRMTAERAREWIAELARQGRYQRDVY